LQGHSIVRGLAEVAAVTAFMLFVCYEVDYHAADLAKFAKRSEQPAPAGETVGNQPSSPGPK
jgi:hypothetical protein